MPRDMTATGRYPPNPRYSPFVFYSAVRLGDPEQLAKAHHLLNNGAEVNQRDERGFTPLHRAAFLAQHDGYLEIYEYLLSRGADSSIRTNNYDPYLDPGKKLPVEVAIEDDEIRAKLLTLDKKYKSVPKVCEPHPDVGDWWTLYDYGLDTVKKWPKDYKHPYPEDLKRARDTAERKRLREERRKRKEAALKGAQAGASGPAVAIHAHAAAAAPAPAAASSVSQTPVAFLFPGQGSQAIGMLKESKDLPGVQEMLAKAKAVLGYDLLQLCLQGPKEKLDDTQYSQPALFVAGLAALERLRAENPSVVSSCSATAGLSLGEYTALVFAGALSFEDGLRVVKVRAESMAAAAKQGRAQQMLSVLSLADAELDSICKRIRESKGGDTVCQISNYLFPMGRVVSGHKDALEEVQQQAVAAGAVKATPLAVSGAFHTALMQPAREALLKVLKEVKFAEPHIPVYSNVTAQPLASAADIPAMLGRQLVEAVQWETTLKTLIGQGKTQLYELGPGQQIKAMTKRIDPDIWKAFKNVAA